jgi:hypothetical protein
MFGCNFQNFLEESTAGSKAVEERTVGVCVKEETAAVYEFADFMFQWLETIKPTVARLLANLDRARRLSFAKVN